MKLYIFQNKLARFFQIDKPLKSSDKLCQFARSGSKILGFSLAVLFFLSQASNLEAQDWKSIHESEVKRIFEIDQKLTSIPVAMVDWEIDSERKLASAAPVKIKPNNFKTTLAYLETFTKKPQIDTSYSSFNQFTNKISPLTSDSFLRLLLLNGESAQIFKSNNLEFLIFLQNIPSQLRNSCLIVSVAFIHPTHIWTKSNKISLKINTESSRHRDLDSMFNILIMELKDSLSPNFIGRSELPYIGIISNKLIPEVREGNSLNKLIGSLITIKENSTALYLKEKGKGQSVRNTMLNEISTMMFSAEQGNTNEKRIVRNENCKILSVWHPNLNELHSVNYSTQCEDYLLKSTTTKSVSDLKYYC